MLEFTSPFSEEKVSNYPKPVAATPLNPRRRGIIIGASDGIGAALARRLTYEGFTLALLARRRDKLEALCDEINQRSNEARARAYVHDVTEY
jgi:short-subunit dehydrogenase